MSVNVTRVPRTGIGNVNGVAWIPASGPSRTRRADGARVPVLRGSLRFGTDGPEITVTLIPRDRHALDMMNAIHPPTAVRFHGRPRPWKSGGDETVMAVICDLVEPYPDNVQSDPARTPDTGIGSNREG